jgi:hypothetical protein
VHRRAQVIVFHNQGDGAFAPHAIATGLNAPHDWDGDGWPDILTIGKGIISLWRNETQRQATRR